MNILRSPQNSDEAHEAVIASGQANSLIVCTPNNDINGSSEVLLINIARMCFPADTATIEQQQAKRSGENRSDHNKQNFWTHTANKHIITATPHRQSSE